MLIVPHGSELIKWVFVLLEAHRAVFGQERVYLRGVLMVMAEIVAPKEHRVTDLLRAVGLVREDWGPGIGCFRSQGGLWRSKRAGSCWDRV